MSLPVVLRHILRCARFFHRHQLASANAEAFIQFFLPRLDLGFGYETEVSIGFGRKLYHSRIWGGLFRSVCHYSLHFIIYKDMRTKYKIAMILTILCPCVALVR